MIQALHDLKSQTVCRTKKESVWNSCSSEENYMIPNSVSYAFKRMSKILIISQQNENKMSTSAIPEPTKFNNRIVFAKRSGLENS